MGLMDEIKKGASKNGTKIQTSRAAELEKIFNRAFYLPKDVEEEVAFVRQVMTRGLKTQERKGLHASALIESETKFCVRQQVLSLLYKQLQGEQINIKLKRIFEEGNCIHEKWQRLFLRAKFGEAKDMDRSRMNKQYEVSYTPDAIIEVPEFYDGKMVGEFKSVNTYQFQKMTNHPSAGKQLQFYMFLTGIHMGFVLCDDKNTQDIKIQICEYDHSIVAPFIDRCEEIKYFKQRALEEGKMAGRFKGCDSITCKRALSCNMKDVCYGKNKDRLD